MPSGDIKTYTPSPSVPSWLSQAGITAQGAATGLLDRAPALDYPTPIVDSFAATPLSEWTPPTRGLVAGFMAGAVAAVQPAPAAPAPAAAAPTSPPLADRIRERLAAIDRIRAIQNPVQRNRAITADYHRLGTEMGQLLGPHAGANWAIWAAWASSRAGETIRGEDSPLLQGVADALSWVAPPATLVSNQMAAARAAVAQGNLEVYEEIAPHYARFIETFRIHGERPNEAQWEEFARGFGPNQGRLLQAFRCYHDAMFESDANRKQELTLRGNLLIGWHEQERLDPRINEALPGFGTNGLTTSFMSLGTPDGPLGLGSDIPPLNGSSFPPHLAVIDDVALREIINRFDNDPNSLAGSLAGNWGSLADRMRFITDLFRSRHMDPRLFSQVPQ